MLLEHNIYIAFGKSQSMIKLETWNPKETKFDFQIASKMLSYSLSTINIWNLIYFKIPRISYPPTFSLLSWVCYTCNFSQSFMYLFYTYVIIYGWKKKKKKKRKCLRILVLWNSLNLVLRPMHYVFCWRLDALVRLNHQSPAAFAWVSKTQKVIESNLQRLSHW